MLINVESVENCISIPQILSYRQWFKKSINLQDTQTRPILTNNRSSCWNTSPGFYFIIDLKLFRKRDSGSVFFLWIWWNVKEYPFYRTLPDDCLLVWKYVSSTFKAKCEKNESNQILITYLYILMASTYMWLSIDQLIKHHKHLKIKQSQINSYQITSVTSEDHNFLYLTMRSFKKLNAWGSSLSSV